MVLSLIAFALHRHDTCCRCVYTSSPQQGLLTLLLLLMPSCSEVTAFNLINYLINYEYQDPATKHTFTITTEVPW